jgi:hypothetical protein
MSRAHFDAIARTLKDERPDRDGTRWADGARDEWSTTVLAFTSLCAGSNPLFDRDRFLKAAGYSVEGGGEAGA